MSPALSYGVVLSVCHRSKKRRCQLSPHSPRTIDLWPLNWQGRHPTKLVSPSLRAMLFALIFPHSRSFPRPIYVQIPRYQSTNRGVSLVRVCMLHLRCSAQLYAALQASYALLTVSSTLMLTKRQL